MANISIYVREESLKRLDYLCKFLSKSRSSLIFDMVDSAYEQIQDMNGLFIDDEKKYINKDFNILDLLNNLNHEIKSLKNEIKNTKK